MTLSIFKVTVTVDVSAQTPPDKVAVAIECPAPSSDIATETAGAVVQPVILNTPPAFVALIACIISLKVAVTTLAPFVEPTTASAMTVVAVGTAVSIAKVKAVGLSEGLNAELQRNNIHVTTVVPNLMRTGSARNVDVKGNHEKEYTMFKIVGSSPLTSQNADTAAKSIINAMERGESEAILSLSGKLASIVKGIAPGWVGMMMSMANSLLPEPTGSMEKKKGFEVEEALPKGKMGRFSDKEAVKNNEV